MMASKWKHCGECGHRLSEPILDNRGLELRRSHYLTCSKLCQCGHPDDKAMRHKFCGQPCVADDRLDG